MFCSFSFDLQLSVSLQPNSEKCKIRTTRDTPSTCPRPGSNEALQQNKEFGTLPMLLAVVT